MYQNRKKKKRKCLVRKNSIRRKLYKNVALLNTAVISIWFGYYKTSAPINVMPAERGGETGHGVGFDCLCWPWGRAFDWSCSPQGRWYLNLSSPDVEIFDCRLERKRLRPNICFPLPCFTHAPYGLERSGNHGGRQRKQAKAGWISLFCLQISFALACFWSIERLKILWYQSKRK